MKSALFLVDPTPDKTESFDHTCAIFRKFQEKGFFRKTSVSAVVYSAMFPLPLRIYKQIKKQLISEAYKNLDKFCRGKLDYISTEVLQSESSSTEQIVSKLCQHAKKRKADLLVMSTTDKGGLPHWLLGSFTQTTSLTATVPVLFIKPHGHEVEFSSQVRFVVGVDVVSPPSAANLKWIFKSAQIADAHIDFIYVEPKTKPGIDLLKWRKTKLEALKVLNDFQIKAKKAGVASSVEVLEEGASRGQSFVDFADRRKAWLIMTVGASRSAARKLLMGSTERQILALTKRPTLSLR